ncbi:MAG: class I SAM-dependent methyltransferase [bacterium]
MQVFKDYAKYYDLLYQDKDYQKEVEYLDNLIKKYSLNFKSILELGSGTGKHAILLSKKGYNLVGVDFSSSMVELAQKRLAKENIDDSKIRFLVGDVREVKLENKFDVVLSLFHVVSYMTTNADIIKMFKTVYDHLNKDGIFIFDCWYGPAVLANKPEKRIKELENDFLKLKRFATPVHEINENLVDVKYDILLQDKILLKDFSFDETHKMRYLFKPELEVFFEACGLKLLKSEEWLTKKELSQDTWGACFVCRKL